MCRILNMVEVCVCVCACACLRACVCVCVALTDRKVGNEGCIQRKDSCQGDSSKIDRRLFSEGTESVNLSASLYDSLSPLNLAFC